MATGRLASGSIGAGAATQLYRNTTGNAQVITLLASSQVSGSAPKLNVKITNENFADSTSVTTSFSGTSHSLAANYPTLEEQIQVYTSNQFANNDISDSGSYTHLSIGQKNSTYTMGQSWSSGYNSTMSSVYDHPWGKVSFGGQPHCIGGSEGRHWRFDDNDRYYSRATMPEYDPYYFENPNAYNQKKARGIVSGADGNPVYHIEDISKMPFEDLKKWYNPYSGASSDYYMTTAPTTDTATYGTVTSRTPSSSYRRRGHFYDQWTGLTISLHTNGYHGCMWIDENDPDEASSNMADWSSNGGIWVWSQNSWNGSDPRSYDTERHGSPYGTQLDIDHGLLCCHSEKYYAKLGFKFFDKFFADGTFNNKDTRARGSTTMATYGGSSYYDLSLYQGTPRAQKLQWLKYNPNSDKYYVCLWDNSGDYNQNPATMGTSYPTEAGIFEVDVTKIYGHSQPAGNTVNGSFADAITRGLLTKKADVPDTTTGWMSKPQRLTANLWTAHCQDRKQYFSNDLYTWAEKSTTHIKAPYEMANQSGTITYYIESGSKSVLYSYSETVTSDVYDQAAIAGIIAKGAVTPYEQKAIILSDGDAIYVENEDATNAISVTAMGVDI